MKKNFKLMSIGIVSFVAIELLTSSQLLAGYACKQSSECLQYCEKYDCGVGSCVGSCNNGVCQYPNWDGSGWSDC